jgi:hypothetical protein
MNNSISITIITAILYLIHYALLWFIYRYEHNKTKEDLLRFGAEFSFAGMSFFATAIPNKASGFFNLLGNTPDVTSVAFWTFVCSAFFFIIDGGSVFFYKRYKEEKRKLKPPTASRWSFFRLVLGNWKLFLSHCLGIVALGAGLKLI